jgi:hypothetical protein
MFREDAALAASTFPDEDLARYNVSQDDFAKTQQPSVSAKFSFEADRAGNVLAPRSSI